MAETYISIQTLFQVSSNILDLLYWVVGVANAVLLSVKILVKFQDFYTCNTCVGRDSKFDYCDYSEDDYDHWKKKKEFLADNESAFINEGNGFLHQKRFNEAKHFASLSEKRKMKRYLYIIINIA